MYKRQGQDAGTLGLPLTQWAVGGQNIHNTRSNPFETTISPANANKLALKWSLETAGDTTATPAVVGGAVYFPDWGGYFYKVDAKTGKLIWKHKISEYNGVEGAVSRTAPIVSGDTVYIGDQPPGKPANGAHLMAIDTATGNLRWITRVHPHPVAALTGAGVLHNGVIYQGVSSREEPLSTLPGYVCCTFRGAVVAVEARTGKILWTTYTIPDNGGVPGGYAGGSVFGTTPVVDPIRRTIYVGTGNNYILPAEVKRCQEAGGTPEQCLSPDNHMDSILALDMATGRIKWAQGERRFDDWNAGCLPGYPSHNCPDNNGPDYGFAAGPQLFWTRGADGRIRQVLGAGEKSGDYWLLNPDDGSVIWRKATGPGGIHGGIEWGTATDGQRVYIAQANTDRTPWTLPDGRTVTSGNFSAVDAATGKVVWQIPDPAGGVLLGAVTVANGVFYAGSEKGNMYAIDARTGKILFDYVGEGSSVAGPAVVNGTVYWSNGKTSFGEGHNGNTFYAFSLGGR